MLLMAMSYWRCVRNMRTKLDTVINSLSANHAYLKRTKQCPPQKTDNKPPHRSRYPGDVRRAILAKRSLWRKHRANPCSRTLSSEYRTASNLGLKKFVVSGNPTDPSFYPRPQKFYGLICAEIFSGSISIGLVFRQTVLL